MVAKTPIRKLYFGRRCFLGGWLKAVAVRLPIYETAANYSGPTLIVQGKHDQIVPYTYAERYNEKIRGSELKLIPDENHSFTTTRDETALPVADWLHNVLFEE